MTDATGWAARQHGARVIELFENLGKGGAIAAGLGATSAQFILLLDGDLVGLTTQHVEDLLRPVLAGTDRGPLWLGESSLVRPVQPRRLARLAVPHG